MDSLLGERKRKCAESSADIAPKSIEPVLSNGSRMDSVTHSRISRGDEVPGRSSRFSRPLYGLFPKRRLALMVSATAGGTIASHPGSPAWTRARTSLAEMVSKRSS